MIANVIGEWVDGNLEIRRADTRSLVARIGPSSVTIGGNHQGQDYFIDPANGSDSKDGRSPDLPVQTWDALIGGSTPKLVDFDRVYFWGTCLEEISTPFGIDYVSVFGLSPVTRGAKWKANADAVLALIRGFGWTFQGFKVEAHENKAAFKFTRQTTATAHDASDFQIIGVEGNTGKYFVELDGAPGNFLIQDCPIHDFTGESAIYGVNPDSVANPLRGRIVRCNFTNNPNGDIILPMNHGKLIGNVHDNVATVAVDLRGGTIGKNVVTRCTLPGTYGTPRCFAGTNDKWSGNYLDGGMSTGNPA